MSSDRPHAHDPRDVDAEFARMLELEGLELHPGEAPHEPAAGEHPRPSDEDPDGFVEGPDSPSEPPSAESRARSRAAHPSAGGHDPTAGLRGAVGPRELDDDEVIYGDFEPPDPDLPQPTSALLWSWTALLGGFVLILVVAISTALPTALGWVGAVAALGGIVSLLWRAPRERRDEGDHGAQV
ncbi:hypothetical protein [Brachybacterium sp. YJGR34]|uniref:hypothetical protein n=1 Tax=Brachybacterium sp. YJGR34 TaxID=2059911 RepID=UPI000E0B09BA|nr:hypothetical protein [Brachybacterium sp. YJGR34]